MNRNQVLHGALGAAVLSVSSLSADAVVSGVAVQTAIGGQIVRYDGSGVLQSAYDYGPNNPIFAIEDQPAAGDLFTCVRPGSQLPVVYRRDLSGSEHTHTTLSTAQLGDVDLAVSRSGQVAVLSAIGSTVYRYGSNGALIDSFDFGSNDPIYALDYHPVNGDLYLVIGRSPTLRIIRLDSSGGQHLFANLPSSPNLADVDLAVSPTGEVSMLRAIGGQVLQFNSSGSPINTFDYGVGTPIFGLDYDSVNGDLYTVAQRPSGQNAAVFKDVAGGSPQLFAVLPVPNMGDADVVVLSVPTPASLAVAVAGLCLMGRRRRPMRG